MTKHKANIAADHATVYVASGAVMFSAENRTAVVGLAVGLCIGAIELLEHELYRTEER
jgi:hypothetical protein